MVEKRSNKPGRVYEFAIVGAGPAAICAIASILKNRIASCHDVAWIDPQFRVGSFGTTLSTGSSVPGNTNVASYLRVNGDIFGSLPGCNPDKKFDLENLDPNFDCPLKVAAEPLQFLTDRLREMLASLEGRVLDVSSTKAGLELTLELADGAPMRVESRRVILAVGARPKTLKLPAIHSNIIMIDPHIAFIETELAKYLRNNPAITTVAVIGSSHSAALATMHLLRAGLSVRQFMNKEYKFARPGVAPDGTRYTMYDNTGLKGDVAKFTRQLLSDMSSGRGGYADRLQIYRAKSSKEVGLLLEEHLLGCSHAVAAVGYERSDSLLINKRPLSEYTYDTKTSEFHAVSGLFGVGIAFPQKVKAISGEVEFSVGVRKFWVTVNSAEVLEAWRKDPTAEKGREEPLEMCC